MKFTKKTYKQIFESENNFYRNFGLILHKDKTNGRTDNKKSCSDEQGRTENEGMEKLQGKRDKTT